MAELLKTCLYRRRESAQPQILEVIANQLRINCCGADTPMETNRCDLIGIFIDGVLALLAALVVVTSSPRLVPDSRQCAGVIRLKSSSSPALEPRRSRLT